jgi:uncharacterized protein
MTGIESSAGTTGSQGHAPTLSATAPSLAPSVAHDHNQQSDALPGRLETIELWPLSQGEIDGTPEGFIDVLFTVGTNLRTEAGELAAQGLPGPRREGRLSRGHPPPDPETTPAVLRQLPRRPHRQRRQTGRGRAADMRRLLSLLAAQTSGLLSVNRLAGELGITAPTVRSYIEILETVYLIRRIPAWSANATTRAVATSKVIFIDSGFADRRGHRRRPGRRARRELRPRRDRPPAHLVTHLGTALPLP